MSPSKRRSRRVPAQLHMNWLKDGQPVAVVCSEINEHGLLIHFPHDRPALGDLLQLVIELPDGPLRAHATARAVNGSAQAAGIGAEIVVLSEHERRRWAKHYRQQLLATAWSQRAPLRDASSNG